MDVVELPRLPDHQSFERLCVDLYEARLRPTRQVQRLGRSGQRQYGLDFIVSIGEERHGFQCKNVTSLSTAAMRK